MGLSGKESRKKDYDQYYGVMGSGCLYFEEVGWSLENPKPKL